MTEEKRGTPATLGTILQTLPAFLLPPETTTSSTVTAKSV